MKAEITIPREKTFKIDIGHYKAKVTQVKIEPAKKSNIMNCCINFELQVPGKENYECCARAVFPLDFSKGSDLRTFLEGLLGSTFFSNRAGQKLDLNQILRGMECEIDVAHGLHDEKKYDWPMVLVVSARPITATQQSTAEVAS